MSHPGDSEIAESQLHSPHTLMHETASGDDGPPITAHNIHASRSVKIPNASAPLNNAIVDHLLQHKLTPVQDESLATDETFNHQLLAEEASRLIASDQRLGMLRADTTGDAQFTAILRKIPLDPEIAFKLTMMRARNPELLRHSIYVALVSIHIGMQSSLREYRLVQLATAALLHDIGILHIDPALLERGHRMSEAERHHLYAHPLTAWTIVKECGGYAPEVLNAILQHHERLDGSGYPQGLSGDDIGQFGKMIAVAEIVASRYGRDDTLHDWLRLETILKLNSRRYGRQFIGHLKIFFQDEAEIPPATEEEKQLVRRHLYAISAVLSGWESTRDMCMHGHLSDFINNRMEGLKIEVLDAGLNPYTVDKNILGMEDDPRACTEAGFLLDEIIWQLHEIIHEIWRRWPDFDRNNPTTGLQPVSDWISDVEMLLRDTAIQ